MSSVTSDDFILRASESIAKARESKEPQARVQQPRCVLDEVAGILRQRRENYGPAEEHFARTVGMVNAMLAHKLKQPLTPHDWAQIMICDKLSRHQEKPIWDNCVDAVGYSALMGETFPRQ
jgi:hypothetical protein